MARLRRFLGWYRPLSLSGQLVPVAALGFTYAAGVVWYGHRWFQRSPFFAPFVSLLLPSGK